MIKIYFTDLNPKIVEALAARFSPADAYPDVVISKQDILKLPVDVIVTPTNAHGNMSGGVDAALKRLFGAELETRLKAEIRATHGGMLSVGEAAVCQLVRGQNRYLVAAATMAGEGEDVASTVNSALACAAAFQAIYTAVTRSGQHVESVAIPGLGGGTGKVPPAKVAEMLHVGYTLFRRRRYASTSELLDALKAELQTRAAPLPEAATADPFLAFATKIE